MIKRTNPALITLMMEKRKLQEEFESKKKQEEQLQLQEEQIFAQQEQKFIVAVNAIFAQEEVKFKAVLSEDKEFIHIYNNAKLVNIYSRNTDGTFKPELLLNPVQISKQEDLIISKKKAELYNLMEQSFK